VAPVHLSLAVRLESRVTVNDTLDGAVVVEYVTVTVSVF
jgi:hypothetical protein